MKISLFPASLNSSAGGVEVYELSLVRALVQNAPNDMFRIYCLRKEGVETLGLRQDNITYKVLNCRSRVLAFSTVLPVLLYRDQFDVFHPMYVPPLFCGTPFAYTVHSSVTWARPHFFPRSVLLRINALQEIGLKRAAVLLCVSNHVRDFISERFKIADERLAVVPHGVSPIFTPSDSANARERTRERHGISRPYFLYVGKLQENKNTRRLIEAHARFVRETGSDIQLVLAGRRLWSQDVNALLDTGVAEGRIIELGNLRQEYLPDLYNAAVALAFPSLWEGFGLPIIEAQACGIPVITSNNSSMPETSGGAALLVDPTDVENIADAMRKLTTDAPLRAQLIAKGLENARQYTWSETARLTLQAYAHAAAM